MTEPETKGRVPGQDGSHYAERDDTDAREPTRYERADGLVRRCRGEVSKYCAWSMSYEGERLDDILKPSGCIDAEKIDRKCPLCGGGIAEDFYGLDDAEVR